VWITLLNDELGRDRVVGIALKGMEMTERFYRDILVLMTAIVALTMAWATSVQAAKKPEPTAYLTPETAGPDFKVQGEYVGTAGEKKIGVQVIALGEGAFQAVIYAGGLPGARWDGKTRHTVDGKTQDSQTLFAPSKAKKRYMGNSPQEFSALRKPPVNGQENYALTLKNKTGAGRKEGPAPGPIYLQGHGNPVFYRNIWIVEKK
jgi:hypothetical protein